MPTHHYTHLTSSPLYTNPTHTIERLSRSSWQITSPLLPSPLPAKTYAEAKTLASQIDFDALSVKAAEPEPAQEDVKKMPLGESSCEVNPFEAIITEAATINDLGTMQPAYDQAVRECDLCAVLGHLSGSSLGDVFGGRFRLAVEAARATVPDYARVTELAGLISDGALLERITYTAREYAEGYEDSGCSVFLSRLIMALCDLPDGHIKTALIRWACAFDQYEGGWPARLRLEGAALRHAREVAFMADCERADREWKEPKKAQEVKGGTAYVWGEYTPISIDEARARGVNVDGVLETLNPGTANRLSRDLMDMRTRADLERHALIERAGRADMGRDSARGWGEVWEWAEAVCVARGNALGSDGDALGWPDVDGSELLPSLLSPEPEHWIPVSNDGRVLVINWRAGSLGDVISAAVWLDDGGLSLLGSYVLGSGWVSVDRLREEDVDAEALGVILEAIASAGLATIA